MFYMKVNMAIREFHHKSESCWILLYKHIFSDENEIIPVLTILLGRTK